MSAHPTTWGTTTAPAQRHRRSIAGIVLVALLWLTFGMAVASRRPLIAAELQRSEDVPADYVTLAEVSGLIFTGLGFGLLVGALFLVARTLDQVAAAKTSAGRMRLFRNSYALTLIVAFLLDLIRNDPSQAFGSALPLPAALVTAGAVFLAGPHRRVLPSGKIRWLALSGAAVLSGAALALMGSGFWIA